MKLAFNSRILATLLGVCILMPTAVPEECGDDQTNTLGSPYELRVPHTTGKDDSWHIEQASDLFEASMISQVKCDECAIEGACEPFANMSWVSANYTPPTGNATSGTATFHGGSIKFGCTKCE
jgi:hypothetical protein